MIMPNGIGTIDSDYRGELMVLATWIGKVMNLLFKRVKELLNYYSLEFQALNLLKEILNN